METSSVRILQDNRLCPNNSSNLSLVIITQRFMADRFSRATGRFYFETVIILLTITYYPEPWRLPIVAECLEKYYKLPSEKKILLRYYRSSHKRILHKKLIVNAKKNIHFEKHTSTSFIQMEASKQKILKKNLIKLF